MRQCRYQGFTLIEVLVALVVVSLGMMAVIEAVGQAANNTAYLRDKTLAHWIAMNRVTELRLAPTPPKIDKSSDEIEYAGRRWRRTVTVSQAPGVKSMLRLDVSINELGTDENFALASVTGFYGGALGRPGTLLIDWEGQSGGGPQAGGGGGTPNPNPGGPQSPTPTPTPTTPAPGPDGPQPPVSPPNPIIQ